MLVNYDRSQTTFVITAFINQGLQTKKFKNILTMARCYLNKFGP